MSIFQFFRILWARRSLIAITFVAALIAALAVIKFVPPSYEARSRIMLDVIRADPVSGEAINANFARAYITTQTELIRDYRVVGRVVDQLGWTGSAALAEEYRQSGSDMEFRRWLAQRSMDRTEASLLPGSNIMEITYTGTEAEASATIADALRDAYEQQTVLFRQQGAARNAEWFRRQVTEIRQRLTAAEDRKASFERTNGIVLNDDATDTDSARLNALASASAMPAAPVISGGAMMPVTSPSQTQLAQIDAAIAVASQQLGPNHPDLQNMQRQRAAVAAAAAQELAAARSAAAASAPRSSGPSAAAEFNAQRNRVLEQRGNLAEARQLLNEVSALRAQLARTSERALQLQQEAESTEAGLTRLGSATAPDSPTFPKTLPVLAISIALGLGLGIILALLVELLNRRIRSVDDLMIENVPVIGVLGAPANPRLAGSLKLLPGPA
jgi:uncharacterized protein involved in exopolysaccharide biosynthesis